MTSPYRPSAAAGDQHSKLRGTEVPDSQNTLAPVEGPGTEDFGCDKW